MRKLLVVLLLSIATNALKTTAQELTSASGEKFKSLNLGVGIGGYSGYYGYIGHSLPVFNLNYEFDVAKDFTLAPFISFYSYSRGYYWNGNGPHPSKYYVYRETVIPIGLKGTYYFDNLLDAGSKWDFYLAGSLGFAIVRTTWDSDYYGDDNYYRHGSPLFLDGHIGAEYHFNSHLGAFLDLSSGVSTIGLAIH